MVMARVAMDVVSASRIGLMKVQQSVHKLAQASTLPVPDMERASCMARRQRAIVAAVGVVPIVPSNAQEHRIAAGHARVMARAL